MKVLFVGNSHTYYNDMPHMFQQICGANGITAQAVMLAHGGKGFDFHLEEPEVRYNILYGGYDYVVLQHKAHPFEEEEAMFAAGRELNQLIRQAGSKPVLYMTWSEQDNEAGQPRMATAYRGLAAETGAALAPVGLAWWPYLHTHPAAEMYDSDGKHASPIGSALAAYTLFSVIAGHKATPVNSSENDLAEAAWNAVCQEG